MSYKSKHVLWSQLQQLHVVLFSDGNVITKYNITRNEKFI